MRGFVLRRLLSPLPLVWGTATLVFLLVAASPGGPFDRLQFEPYGRNLSVCASFSGKYFSMT